MSGFSSDRRKPTSSDGLSRKPLATLIFGPPRSGKTTRMIGMAQDHLESGAKVLFLVPNRPAIQRPLCELARLAENRLRFFRVSTLEGVAARAARLRASAREIAKPAHCAALIGWIARRAAAKGELPLLGAASFSPGFGRSLFGHFEEIVSAGIEPEAYSDFAQSRASGKMREISKIHRRYLSFLNEHSLDDPRALYYRACDGLRSLNTHAYDFILVDGFQILSQSQLVFLSALASSARMTCFAFSAEEQIGVAPLGQTLSRVKEYFDVQGSEQCEAEALPTAPFRSLWKTIFREKEEADKSAVVLEVIEAPEPDAEIEAIASRAKEFIVDGGLRPEEICVIMRDLHSRREQTEHVFRRMGVPCQVAAQTSVLASGLIRDCLALLRAIAEDLPAQRLADLLRSPYFRFKSFAAAEQNAPDAATAVETLCRAAGITHCTEKAPGEIEALAKRCRLLADRETDRDIPAGMEPQEILKIVEFAYGPLKQILEQLNQFARERRVFSDWVGAFEKLLAQLGLSEAFERVDPGDEAALTDLCAWQEFSQELRELKRLSAELSSEKMDAGEFERFLTELAAQTTFRSMEREGSAVRILDPFQARPVRFRAVFVSSLQEGIFPKRQAIDAFGAEEDRNALGLPPVSGQEEEKQLFLQAISRADEYLVLSRSYMDFEARPTVESSFLREAVDAVEKTGGSVLKRHVAVSPQVTDFSRVWAPHQIRRHCLWRFLHREKGDKDFYEYFRCADRNPPGSMRRAAQAILVENRRWSPGPCDEYDGVLGSANALDYVRKLFPPAWSTSPSRLNQYGYCPFSFLARNVLNLREPDDFTAGLDPLALGAVLHQTLADFLRGLQPRERQNPKDHAEALHATAERALAQFAGTRSSQYSILWQAEKNYVHAVLQAFLEKGMEVEPSWTPARFEADFGGRPKDAARDFGPLLLTDGELTVALRGRIDRIDELETGDGIFLKVIDYKNRIRPCMRPQEAMAGVEMQIPLYMFAAADVLYAGRPSALYKGLYVGLLSKPDRAQFTVRKRPELSEPLTEEWIQTEERLREKPVEFLARMRRGDFATTPAQSCADSACPYRPICRMSEARLLRKKDFQENG